MTGLELVLLGIHITSGMTALFSGFVGIFAVKGLSLHRRSGTVFLFAMIGLGVSGVTLAIMKSQPANIVGGAVALYLVVTGVQTLRDRGRGFYWPDPAGIFVALGIVYFSLRIAFLMLQRPSGKMDGVPPAPMFVFAGVVGLAVVGDVRMMLMRGLKGRQRMARHVWRMSFALFIASGSFFLGQAKVIPRPIRILPLLVIPAFLPLLLMIYWLGRVSLTQWYRRHAGAFVKADRGLHPAPTTGFP